MSAPGHGDEPGASGCGAAPSRRSPAKPARPGPPSLELVAQRTGLAPVTGVRLAWKGPA